MALMYKDFPTGESSEWIFGVYRYWYKHVKPEGRLNNFDFYRWFKETYNLEWSQSSRAVHILAYSEEDWMRFYLEWAE